jgi:hypothetical protein
MKMLLESRARLVPDVKIRFFKQCWILNISKPHRLSWLVKGVALFSIYIDDVRTSQESPIDFHNLLWE